LSCGAVEDRKPGSSDHRVRTVVLQRRPVENQIFAGPWCQGREIGEIGPSGRDDDRDRPQKGNARDTDNQNQCPPLFTWRDTKLSSSSWPQAHRLNLRAKTVLAAVFSMSGPELTARGPDRRISGTLLNAREKGAPADRPGLQR